MEKTWKAISSWGSFHCKNRSFCGRKSGRPPCSEGAEKRFQHPPGKLWCWRRPEWRRLNFDESFFHNWWPWKSCEPTRLHQHTAIHFTLTSAHQFAYEKHSKKKTVGEMLGIMGNPANSSLQIGQPQVWTNFAVPRNKKNISSCSTLLVPYCHTAHMCWNQFWRNCLDSYLCLSHFKIWFLSFEVMPSGLFSAKWDPSPVDLRLQSGIRHPWIYVFQPDIRRGTIRSDKLTCLFLWDKWNRFLENNNNFENKAAVWKMFPCDAWHGDNFHQKPNQKNKK